MITWRQPRDLGRSASRDETMNATTFTIDVAFFTEASMPFLHELLAHQRSGRSILYTSAFPYTFSHQSTRFSDLTDYLPELRRLPATGGDLADDRVHFAIGKGTSTGLYQAKFTEESLATYKAFATALYGKWGYSLKLYESYRVFSLLDHLRQGIAWFVTCDQEKLLGKHGRQVLDKWSIRACSPKEAVRLMPANRPQ